MTGQVAFTRRAPFSPGQAVRVVDSRPPGERHGVRMPAAKAAVTFKAGQTVTVKACTPLGLFVSIEGHPGMFHADRFAPLQTKEA